MRRIRTILFRRPWQTWSVGLFLTLSALLLLLEDRHGAAAAPSESARVAGAFQQPALPRSLAPFNRRTARAVARRAPASGPDAVPSFAVRGGRPGRTALALHRGEGNDRPPQKKKEKKEYKGVDDGRGVGFVLLAFSLGLAVWLFTIPPSFRRAYLCPSDYFDAAPSGVDAAVEPPRDCTTISEWFGAVADYYRNGGGIQWDFSIDPQTLQDNREFLDAVVRAYSKTTDPSSP